MIKRIVLAFPWYSRTGMTLAMLVTLVMLVMSRHYLLCAVPCAVLIYLLAEEGKAQSRKAG
jgi:hypothetical protein